MKKHILIFTVILTFSVFYSFNASAQGMEVGKNNLGIGIGAGHNYYGTLTGFTPAGRINFDHGFFEAGPGVITIGGSVGVSSHSYKYTYWSYTEKYRWTNFVIATRGAWHYNFGQIGPEKLNAYGGIGLGLRIESYSYSYDGSYTYDPYYNESDGGVFPHFATFVGGSYQATDNVGFFAEFGYDITNALIGVNFRF